MKIKQYIVEIIPFKFHGVWKTKGDVIDMSDDEYATFKFYVRKKEKEVKKNVIKGS